MIELCSDVIPSDPCDNLTQAKIDGGVLDTRYSIIGSFGGEGIEF
jgi:hypothetical protein